MKTIHLLRKPCSESTVAANVLRWGTGALNIDATRIGANTLPTPCKGTGWAAHDKKNAEQGYRPTAYYEGQDGVAYSPNNLGRWPANLVLQHLDGCHIVGTTTVRGDSRTPDYSPRQSGMFNVGQVKSDGRPRGTLHGDQSVLAYDCKDGCPVAALDVQSGERPSGGSSTNVPRNVGLYEDGLRRRVITPRTDTGGASRYFKQFIGKVTGEE